MAHSLKDQNRIGLYAVVAANLAFYFATLRSHALLVGDWPSFASSWTSVLPAGLGLIIVGVLNAQIDATTKARLVYLRWHNPLPASEAFSRLGPADERVDMDVLAANVGRFPSHPREQNSLWYRLYKTVEDTPAIQHALREYLFTRDYHFLSVLMLIGLGTLAIVTFEGVVKTLVYLAILFVQFAMTGQAARTHGRRLVSTVLAQKSAE